MAKTLLPMWPSSIVESVCEVLADTATGLTGDEIGRLLDKIDVHDIDSSATKRHRLSYALLARQQRDQAGNCIVRFIAEAMAPGRHFKDPTRRQNIQDGLNERLLLMGLKVRQPPAWDLRHLPQPAGTHSPGDPGVDDHRSRRLDLFSMLSYVHRRLDRTKHSRSVSL